MEISALQVVVAEWVSALRVPHVPCELFVSQALVAYAGLDGESGQGSRCTSASSKRRSVKGAASQILTFLISP